jgi:hypothetical protein
VIPRWLAVALFFVVIAQFVCALVVLVLALVASPYMFVALNLFGALLTVRAGTFVVFGIIRGSLPYHEQSMTRSAHPVKFWGLMIGNLLGVLVGLFFMRLPIH